MATASFTIRIVNADGDEVSGARIKLAFCGPRGMSVTEHTGRDGRAEFSGYDEGEVEVYVDGRDQGRYSDSDRDEVTIQV